MKFLIEPVGWGNYSILRGTRNPFGNILSLIELFYTTHGWVAPPYSMVEDGACMLHIESFTPLPCRNNYFSPHQPAPHRILGLWEGGALAVPSPPTHDY